MPQAPALGYVGWAKQASPNTPLAPIKFARWQSAMLSPKMTVKAYHDGTNRDLGAAVKVGVWDEGTFKTMLYPDTGSMLLKLALAGVDVLTSTADPWTHTFSSTQSALDFITFEYSHGQGQEIERITDCMLDLLVVDSKAGESILVDVGYKGRIVNAQASPTTVTFETDRPLTFIDGTLTFTGLPVVSANVTEFKLSIKNNVGMEWGHGSPNVLAIFAQSREIDLDFSVFVPDNALWRTVWFGSSTATTPVSPVTFLTTLVALFSAGTTPARSVQMTINNIGITDAKPTYDNSGKSFIVQCTGKVILPASGASITVVGVNGFGTAY